MKIYRGPTFGAIYIGTSGPFYDYLMNFVYRQLTDFIFDPKEKCYKVNHRFIRYDRTDGVLRFPIRYLDTVRTLLNNSKEVIEIVDMPVTTPRSINVVIPPKFKPRDERQAQSIKFLTEDLNYRRGLELQTGVGKTFCAIEAISILGLCSIIICSGLTNQWVNEIKRFTKLSDKPEDIYVIEGYDSLMRLFRNKYKPKVFVASLQTLRVYMEGEDKYANLPHNFIQFFDHFQIGIKIIDEVHLNFYTTTLIDLRTRVQHNIYLTATFINNNAITRRIFNQVYPTEMRFGGNNYKKYVVGYMYDYSLCVNERRCGTSLGYAHAKYEHILLKNPKFFNIFCENLYYLIDQHFGIERKSNQKAIIFVSTIAFANQLNSMLQGHYSTKYKINVYVQDTDDSVLVESDIIISTFKSAGTGKDIKNLLTVFNTCSFKARGLLIQVLGRLRELKDGSQPVFVDMSNCLMSAHQRHRSERIAVLREKLLKLTERNLL